MAEWQNGLFALPPGIDFAGEFVRGFLHRMQDQPPEMIARATIYANSNRTLTAIQGAFDRHGPLLLPRLRAVTDLGAGPVAGQDALAAPLARRLQLARLIDRLLQQRPDLAAGHSLPLLARSLANLMGEMQSEGLGPEALETIDTGDHARHWENALSFLRIAAQFHLTDMAADRPARQRAASERAAADWSEGRDLPVDPVIVAGSTGSQGATRLFMQTVAALPNGAVVLPGFDWEQPQQLWEKLGEHSEDHPQHRFAPLIEAIGYPRHWTDCTPPSTERSALVSLALRPAPVTDQWIAEGPGLKGLASACEGLTLIEADQPGTEAETIALIMRKAAEDNERITLFAADRGLIRRVLAALDRWQLLPDDSAGQPLSLTAAGLFLRHIAALFGQPMTIDRLLTLLKHPLAATGSTHVPPGEARQQARELELTLRKRGPAFPDGDSLRNWADKGNETRKIWAKWVAEVLDRAAIHAKDHKPRPLSERVHELRSLAEMLAAGPGGDAGISALWEGKRGGRALAVLEQLATHAGEGPPMGPADFASLLHDELQAQLLRGDVVPHPLLRIRGPREARSEGHGTVILSGLNEGQWPQAADLDPWLSRQMRAEAGMPSPERALGLAAHDFQQGIAASRVFLTRAKRNAEAETIASRWLNRLTNLLSGLKAQQGDEVLEGMRKRGAGWLAIAGAIARPTDSVAPEKRPSPIPPAPPFRELPVTDISHLIRDPYAIYAKRVLGLRPLNPLRPEPDAALRGQTLHSIVERLLRGKPNADTPPDELRDDLLRITAEVLAKEVPWPAARAFWQARIGKIADQIVRDELRRLKQGQPLVIERRGKVSLPGMDFTLTAKPDRIDLLHDGRAMIYDYKSGKPPSNKQIEHYDKQLILEAAMVRQGGFDALGPVDVAGISYIQLGGDGGTHDRDHSAEMEAGSWEKFVGLIGAYLSGDQGFTAMRAPEFITYAGDYDHLARYGEWVLTDKARPEKVGGDG